MNPPRTDQRSDFLGELAWRGLLYQRTAETELDEHLATPGRVGYCGFDPTADSLTIGNLIAIRLLMLWQRCGHRPIALVGGATALIGDPSGKDAERPMLRSDQVEHNVQSQRRILERLLDFDSANPCGAVLVNNWDWLGKLGFLMVLRDVGKHFSVNAMIQREAVKERLHGRGQGISYTEFSYALLQAYDFLHLRREHGCTVQTAGSDQYGNIVSGIDLIRRVLGSDEGAAYGITSPLVTHADGRKIGKTERGAVWLTADRTSPYAFYQYWINVADGEVESFLKWFTMLDAPEIDAVVKRHGEAPHERHAQRALADHMTELLHGGDERRRVAEASEAIFGRGDLRALDEGTLAQVVDELPTSRHPRDRLAGEGCALVDLLPETELARSKREAREFLANGAVSVNGERVDDPERRLGTADLLHSRSVLLRRGKKQWAATVWE